MVVNGNGNGSHAAGLADEALVITITAGMLRIPGLSEPDLVLLGRIHALTHGGGSCWASNRELAAVLKRTAKHISERINDLIERKILDARYLGGRRYLLVKSGHLDRGDSDPSGFQRGWEGGGSKEPIRHNPDGLPSVGTTRPDYAGSVGNTAGENGGLEQANRPDLSNQPVRILPHQSVQTEYTKHTESGTLREYHPRACEGGEFVTGQESVPSPQSCWGSVPQAPPGGGVSPTPPDESLEASEGMAALRDVAADAGTALRDGAGSGRDAPVPAAEGASDRAAFAWVRDELLAPIPSGFGLGEVVVESLMRAYPVALILKVMPACRPGPGVRSPSGALIASLKAGKAIVNGTESGKKGGSTGSGSQERHDPQDEPRGDDRAGVQATKAYREQLKEGQPPSDQAMLSSLAGLLKQVEGWGKGYEAYAKRIEQQMTQLREGMP